MRDDQVYLTLLSIVVLRCRLNVADRVDQLRRCTAASRHWSHITSVSMTAWVDLGHKAHTLYRTPFLMEICGRTLVIETRKIL